MTYSPGDVFVEHTSIEGCYISYKKSGHNRIPISISFPDENVSALNWAMDLDDSELEAAIQICYDDWNFSTSKPRIKELFEAAIYERYRRLLPHSTFAPGIFEGEDPTEEDVVSNLAFLEAYRMDGICNE